MADALGTPGGVVSDEDHRLDLAGLIAANTSSLAVRTGVLAAPNTRTLVTGTSTTGTMTVTVGAHHWVTSRTAGDGVYLGTKEAATTVNIAAAPGTNSRIDVVYSKQNDSASTVTPDGSVGELYGVVTGTAAVSPTKPSLPVGAVELATVQVAAGATNTLGAGVTITNTGAQTVARGGVIPVRNKAERDAIIGHDGQVVWRQDLHILEVLSGVAGTISGAFGAPGQLKTSADATIDDTDMTVGTKRGMHSAVTITRPYGVGVPFQGRVTAAAYVVVQGASSEVSLAAIGDPDTTFLKSSREQNSSGIAENRGLVSIDTFDTGSLDSFSYQPIFKAETGTVKPLADARLTYSIIEYWPKAL